MSLLKTLFYDLPYDLTFGYKFVRTHFQVTRLDIIRIHLTNGQY